MVRAGKRSLFRNSRAGKEGALDGLNLFFGALLGANLGTLDAMALVDYIQLTTLLAATVMTLRMFVTSERRVYMFVVLAIYALLLAAFVTLPSLKPEGLRIEDLHRLVATLSVWMILVVAIVVSPVRDLGPSAEQPQAPSD
jgi:predicted membrane channel-forming protein YqfA (hemolysin III family)